jgi:hypothetical protein
VLNPRRFFLILMTSMSLLATVGCSSNNGQRPKVVRAGGVVHFNGQPLADAHVTFTNTTDKVSAYARTDANGKFTLTTFEQGDGAVPGLQQISVSKVEMIGHADPTVDRTTTTEKVADPQRRWLIPEHYGSPTTSGLTAEIAESGNKEIVLELKGDASNEPAKSTPARPAAGLRPDR